MPEALLFSADLAAPTVPLRQPWQWCVGSGHATLALRADWQAQLAQAHRDLGFKYVRFHGILDDDMGTLICQSGEPLYSFFNTDRIFDFLQSIGMKPVVELSFMPLTLASGHDTVFHYQGNITPPADMKKWGELVNRLVSHWVSRYGLEEVSTWPFECWNEPNLKAFWMADQDTYFALYRTTADAIKSIDQRLLVGGPATAANAWLNEFKTYCGKTGTPLDFLSTHYYPTDSFGSIDTDTTTQLERSPPGVMRTRAQEARDSAGDLPLYYTEWNITSNPRDPFHDSSFAAALAVRIAMSVDDLVDGYSYWTFSDIFEENYFPSVPFHGGFGLLNLYAVPKPVYRAFEMLRALGSERVEVAGEHENVAVWLTHGATTLKTHVLLINQAMPRHSIEHETVRLRLRPLPQNRARAASVYRIDDQHCNPAQAWRAMGSPEYPKSSEVEVLMRASTRVAEPVEIRIANEDIEIELTLAPQSVNHIEIEWEHAS